ncbi:hypothetical protein [Methanoregula sp.]|nr:hypothetical protein [Methanoregula sp.]HVP96387.1 hypothetical protein [Methanoregula sp.]
MTAEVSAQPALNGFRALSKAEKRWFMIRVHDLPRIPAKESPALKCQPVS